MDTQCQARGVPTVYMKHYRLFGRYVHTVHVKGHEYNPHVWIDSNAGITEIECSCKLANHMVRQVFSQDNLEELLCQE